MVLNIYFAFRKLDYIIYEQFREAICAMSEEMRHDESIYLMGEEVAGIMVLTRHRKVCLLSLVQKE
jgi:hypothetical protein